MNDLWKDDEVLVRVCQRAKQQKTIRQKKNRKRPPKPTKQSKEIQQELLKSGSNYYVLPKKKKKRKKKVDFRNVKIKYDYASEFTEEGWNNKKERLQRSIKK